MYFNQYVFSCFIMCLCKIELTVAKNIGIIHLEEKISSVFNESKVHQNFSTFLKDLVLGLQSNNLLLAYGEMAEKKFDVTIANRILNENNIATTLFSIHNNNTRDMCVNLIAKSMEQGHDVNCVVMCNTLNCESFLSEVKKNGLIRRGLLYIFYWGELAANDGFVRLIHETMRIAIVANPRQGVFRVYYNQATSQPTRSLPLVNWWSGRLYRSPTLPPAKKVFDDFGGRVFKVPVLHVPPWHFVSTYNDSAIKVTGGRDHQLLNLLAHRLNFQYEYFDPPDHSQGSGLASNGSFKGVLGLIHRREADFFLGDVTITSERQRGVEFSFFTLADSGAFLTHAPRRLSETHALIRPFRFEVWPAIVASVVVSGPALWVVAAGAALWRPHRSPPPPKLSRCVWFGISIFLKQSGNAPSRSIRARALTLLLSLAATYVLGDVYSATLTSLLARPGREPPLNDLFELERAMTQRGYNLYVERRSSSISMLQNGTGVYRRVWNLMQRQESFVVRTVELGVREMLQRPGIPVALLAGRETLYFDARRFGAGNFQLSEKLYTKYSSVALQQGCPYIENFNRVIMQLFEAGILTKITSEEYEKLGESGMDGSADSSGTSGTSSGKEVVSNASSPQKLEPISMKMLQGAFYVLMFGYAVSGLTLLMEIASKRRRRPDGKKVSFKLHMTSIRVVIDRIRRCYRGAVGWLRWRYYRVMALSDLSLDFIN